MNDSKLYKFKNKRCWWGAIWPCLVYLGSSILISIIAVIIITIINIKDINKITAMANDATFNIIITIIVQLVSLAVFLPVYIHNKKKNYQTPENKPNIKMIILSIFVILLVGNVCDLLLDGFTRITHFEDPLYKIVDNIIGEAPLYLNIISVVILAPIVEELMLRGLGLNSFLSEKNYKTSIILSALIFGLIHFDFGSIGTSTFGNEMLNLPDYVIAGLALSFIYDKYGLAASFTTHAANNLFSVISILLTQNT